MAFIITFYKWMDGTVHKIYSSVHIPVFGGVSVSRFAIFSFFVADFNMLFKYLFGKTS